MGIFESPTCLGKCLHLQKIVKKNLTQIFWIKKRIKTELVFDIQVVPRDLNGSRRQ